jgi:N-acetylglutamate synthase-like GNAT family acetyltransferase
MLNNFKKIDLISKKSSPDDNRIFFIELTDKGNVLIKELVKASNNQIEQLFSSLSIKECDEVCHAMKTIKKNLTKATTNITIRPFASNDNDFIISRQINLYKIEYGFNSDKWKAYIKDGVKHLFDQFNQNKDCVYILEVNNNPSGCIAITHTKGDIAQLRFFFVEPTLRGLGTGNMLINKAISFCKQKHYKQVILWTFSELHAARHLYHKLGFQIIDTRKNSNWGEPIVEECWSLNLQ